MKGGAGRYLLNTCNNQGSVKLKSGACSCIQISTQVPSPISWVEQQPGFKLLLQQGRFDLCAAAPCYPRMALLSQVSTFLSSDTLAALANWEHADLTASGLMLLTNTKLAIGHRNLDESRGGLLLWGLSGCSGAGNVDYKLCGFLVNTPYTVRPDYSTGSQGMLCDKGIFSSCYE